MLRLTHTQTVSGAILVDDVDDALPNKTPNRVTADPKASSRDGYASGPKQKCYVPRTKPGDATIAGYIDLNESDRVILSAANGKIAGLVRSGKITVTSLVASDLSTPTIATAALSGGNLTVTGTNLLSVAPDFTLLTLTGSGAKTLTQTQITTGGGTISNTTITVPAALIPGVAVSTTSARVRADNSNSNLVALT